MYQEFYGLRERPFSIQPDPDFLFLGKRHSMAFAVLEYGVQSGAGFSVISGEIGCGKTTLIRHLLNRIGPDITVGLISNTHPDIANLLEWAMLALDQPYDGMSPVALYDAFQKFLIAEHGAGRRVLLIVDEAQNLSAGALESLRMLSNINADKHQLLQVVLVGQPQLNDVLRQPELAQFAQRVSAHFFIPPLDSSEVGRYIRHRVKVAGRETPLFTLKACDSIAAASKGVPRSINVLCENALVYGFSAEREWIDDELVAEVIQDRIEYGLEGIS
jgi:type II secretory pathway predicted ATPase ExeA